ncbi:hypothetical protein BASA60_000424 [Batrachochytrium salamandrivorans]|nr:hypothetical protein BASA60_000424 [Batrachochytrium salamandrivorans]
MLILARSSRLLISPTRLRTRPFPVPRRDATEGFSMVANPEFKGSSPNGWTAGKATGGNNVVTSDTRGKTTSSTSDGVFDTKFNGDDEPSTDDNIAASAVNLFYVSNLMHDITYQYGFTEKAGNFQKDNFGKGGQDGDAVVVNVLNTSKVNNANFFAPPDGQPGEMNMFRFTYTTPSRSGGFDNGIPIHEYGHGVSVRLTGGSATGECLGTDEAGGMGEGWSDMMALFVLAKESDTATTSIPMGAYVAGKPEVYWSLVTKHGFSANLHDAKQSAGNIVAMQNIIGGLMTQPCNPTFLSARDAIVAADASYYKGANKCEILKAFAKRGLGSKATSSRKSDFSVPSECDGNAPSPDPTATDTEETTTTTKRSRTTTKKTKTTATEEATTTTKRSRTTTKRSRTTSRAPEPTDEPDDPTDDPTFELDEFAKM